VYFTTKILHVTFVLVFTPRYSLHSWRSRQYGWIYRFLPVDESTVCASYKCSRAAIIQLTTTSCARFWIFKNKISLVPGLHVHIDTLSTAIHRRMLSTGITCKEVWNPSISCSQILGCFLHLVACTRSFFFTHLSPWRGTFLWLDKMYLDISFLHPKKASHLVSFTTKILHVTFVLVFTPRYSFHSWRSRQ
jgi:hypothetical protein